MTKIDLGTGAKGEKGEKGEKAEQPVDSTDQLAVDLAIQESAKEAQKTKEHETAIKLQEILASIGMDAAVDIEPEAVEEQLIGVDWNFIARISKTQLILSIVSIVFFNEN
jgi:hypothetical protein